MNDDELRAMIRAAIQTHMVTTVSHRSQNSG
jgi:hypothetical protein